MDSILDFIATLDFQLLIPIIVPALVSGLKRLLSELPTWTLPIAAGVMGVILQGIEAALTSGDIHPGVGVLLGLAGVGIREVYDQQRQRSSPEDDGAPRPIRLP